MGSLFNYICCKKDFTLANAVKSSIDKTRFIVTDMADTAAQDIGTIGETINYLQGFVHVKIDNVVHAINVTPDDLEGKQVNATSTVSTAIATTIWNN